jgi:hypothetical protein
LTAIREALKKGSVESLNRLIIRAVLVSLITTLIISPGRMAKATEALPTDLPVVYVAPQHAFAAVGTMFNVSVKIFNLTNRFYPTATLWSPGEELGPYSQFGPYNYSLGNLYGFTLQLRWNPAALRYVRRLVHTPVEEHPDGVLYGPVIDIQDTISSTAGTYSLVQYSAPYLQGFNCVNRSVTICTLTFRVLQEAAAAFHLEHVELIPDPTLVIDGIRDVIPMRTVDGQFTPVATSHIAEVDIGVLVGTQLYNPVIIGENATVQVQVANDGDAANAYNLTLHEGAHHLTTWTNETLPPAATDRFTYTLRTTGMDAGTHTITAKARITYEDTVSLDTAAANFTLIRPPTLTITRSATDVRVNDAVTLSAAGSVHQDPTGQLTSYVWIIYKPSSVLPVSRGGETIVQNFTEEGTWRIVLMAEDSWGLSYNPDRDVATAPYKTELRLDVSARNQSSPNDRLTYEQIVLIVGVIGAGALGLLIYVIARKRRNG